MQLSCTGADCNYCLPVCSKRNIDFHVQICGTDIAVSRSEQWILQEANITSKCGLEPVADRLVVGDIFA